MKSCFIFLLLLTSASAFGQEKFFICEYGGMTTIRESGFWLQSKQDKNWYKVESGSVVKSYRPADGEVCNYR